VPFFDLKPLPALAHAPCHLRGNSFTCPASGPDTPIHFFPIVPNRIADKYIPASYQNIGGYLGYRLNVNLEKRLLRIDSAIILSGFEKRPGTQTWIGEHVGKFLFSASKTYSYTHDSRLRQMMDAIAQTYISCQLSDGYLGTYLEKDRWTAWDVWAHKYAIIGLLGYYSVTGYQPALETAERAADLICRTFGDHDNKRDLMLAGEHAGLAPGSILEPMVDLYRYTKDQKYLDFCRYILRAFEQPNGPNIVSRLEQTGDVTRVGDAKAYEMLSCFLGILKYYKLTGEEKYLRVLEAAWMDIKARRLYITGTASDHEVFKSAGDLKATNADEMGEGCVTVTWIQFNLGLLQLTGDPKYAGEMERSVYNHMLAAENPQTGCVSYYTALLGVKPYRCDQGFSCCLSSVPRGISLVPEMLGGNIDGTFTILFFENGLASTRIRTADAGDISLQVKTTTKFPATGLVDLSITPSKTASFDLGLRVPDWAVNFRATVGKTSYRANKGSILRIRRKWRPGDHIRILFGMPVEILTGGVSYPNAIAVKRGPQVLAVDKGLNPGFDSTALIRLAQEPSLTDATDSLPVSWGWREAFYLDANCNNIPRKLLLVPFAEAGQTTFPIAVWINRSN
jgi:DUF1680 family protein